MTTPGASATSSTEARANITVRERHREQPAPAARGHRDDAPRDGARRALARLRGQGGRYACNALAARRNLVLARRRGEPQTVLPGVSRQLCRWRASGPVVTRNAIDSGADLQRHRVLHRVREVGARSARRSANESAEALDAGRQLRGPMKPVRTIELTSAAPLDGRGQRSPGDVVARSVRDHFLREAARRHCAGMSERAAAAMLRSKLGRYREGGWRRDRSEALCPARHRGTIIEQLFCVLMVRDALPSVRSIRRALSVDPFSWPKVSHVVIRTTI